MASDERLAWLDKRVGTSLGRQAAISGDADNSMAALEFFERPDIRCLFVCSTGDGCFASTTPESNDGMLTFCGMKGVWGYTDCVDASTDPRAATVPT